ncbi:hypothetical protein [Sphingomonas sp.]|uniref:hypothetical protein n=1 Tax=Sphingomonas sp. TaxID=28214 RepID=UPI003CC54F0F
MSNLDMTGYLTGNGGHLPSKADRADLDRYIVQMKKQVSELAGLDRAAEARGRAEAHAAAAAIRARYTNPRVRHAALALALAEAQAEAIKAECELRMMQVHMGVDLISIVDPSLISTGVSVWMIYQEGQMQ